MNTEARFCCHCGRPIVQYAAWNAAGTRLTRPRYGRMIAGVCAGIADMYGWDPVLVRLGAVALFFAGFGSVLVAYVVAWIVMPNGPLFWATPMVPGYSPAPPAGGTPAA